MNDDLMIGGGIPNIGGPKVDPRDYPSVKCNKCGGILFRSAVVLKEIPGTVVGNGADPVVFPLQVMVCDKCGTVLESDIKAYKLENELLKDNIITDAKPAYTENNNDNIIIS